jgi:hypothetical protein
MLDANNQIHILQNSSPKQYIYSHLGLGGEVFTRQAYTEMGKSRPSLAKQAGGSVAVMGGRPFTPGEEDAIEDEADKAGDRPVPLPGS